MNSDRPAQRGFNVAAERIFTISSAALTLTVVFRESLLGSHPSNIWTLKVAWIAFCLSTLACVGLEAMQGVILSKIRFGGPDKITRLDRWMFDFVLAVSSFGCAIGVSMLAVFGLFNL